MVLLSLLAAGAAIGEDKAIKVGRWARFIAYSVEGRCYVGKQQVVADSALYGGNA